MSNRTPDHGLPTLADVAEMAGVSTATVSRCLNAPDKVGQKTRDRVMQAVEDLGYSPNFGARALAARRTHTVGAVIPTMDNAIFARGLQAFEEELNENGFTLLVASSNYQPDREEAQIRTLVARGADALLLIGHDRDPAIYDFLDRQGIPTLIAWTYDPTKTQHCIGFDNRAALLELAQHVIDLGHRNMAFISAHTDKNDRARERVQGARDAMIQAGIAPTNLRVIETNYSITNGAAAFKQIIQDSPQTTMVFCGNDVLAVGALRQAHEMGISVPDDLSITGFDDIEIATITNPMLTTVHVPHRKMGRDAAQFLMAQIKQSETPVTTGPLPTHLCMRGTLAAPKG